MAGGYSMGKFISGLPTDNNLDNWANYAKRNSFDTSETKAQSRDDLAPCGRHDAENDWDSKNWHEAHKDREGRGWADMKATTADNTCTGKGGSKRD